MDEQQPKRRSISLGFILSFVLVIGLIGVMIYFMFFNNSSTSFKLNDFVKAANNNQVTEVTSNLQAP